MQQDQGEEPAVKTKAKQSNRRGKSIEEVVEYAVSHRIRTLILHVLNEGSYTATEIADLIGEPLNNVANHIRKLHEAGSIEVAKIEPKANSNLVRHYYRAVELPYVSEAEAEEMPVQQRQMIAGLVVQTALGEVMAALWRGNLADPRTVLLWDRLNVDQQGREELEAESMRYLDRVKEIEAEATNRRADSQEDAQSMIVTVFAYERARSGPSESFTKS